MADLWIKTQTKNQLLKVDNVERNGLYISTYMHNTTIELGYYDPEERAIEVFDEIQSKICPNYKGLFKNIKNKNNNINDLTNIVAIQQPDGALQIQELSTVVYEMPES